MEQRKTEDKIIFFKSNYVLIRLDTREINYVKALADYVIIETDDAKYVTQSTMKDMKDNLPSHFHRIHRSFIVNEHKIVKKAGSRITIIHKKQEISFNISRTRKKEVKRNLFK